MAQPAPPSATDLGARCRDWKLETDMKLLLYLEGFQDKLAARVAHTSAELSSLVAETGFAEVSLRNALNALIMLSNTQFVENRVAEPDEASRDRRVPEEPPPRESLDELELAEAVHQRYVAAVAFAKHTLDDRARPLDESLEGARMDHNEDEDQESDELSERCFGKYRRRRLPFVIGTREFFEDDFVGLKATELDEDEEDEEEEEEDLNDVGD
eukprot:RCo031859